MSEAIQIWTDGGCTGNPGPGAWAYVLRSPEGTLERSGYDPDTTNNRMELTAVREALGEFRRHPAWQGSTIELRTDSQYVQKGITEWILSWERNGWKTSAKKPVKNVELWQALSALSRDLPITWLWVLGHAGNPLNERCDALVQQAIAAGVKRRD